MKGVIGRMGVHLNNVLVRAIHIELDLHWANAQQTVHTGEKCAAQTTSRLPSRWCLVKADANVVRPKRIRAR